MDGGAGKNCEDAASGVGRDGDWIRSGGDGGLLVLVLGSILRSRHVDGDRAGDGTA